MAMHEFDPTLADRVFDYLKSRLSLPETPLDLPGDEDMMREALRGLITPTGRPAAEVLDLYDQVISRTVISADSPRFLAFIPAAPTKAALLFDMVVSCASLQAISWLEAAGAVAAENQTLQWLAGLAGLPDSAGGVFVSGGSAANLAALTVARDEGRRRLGARVPVRIAVSAQAHSSNVNALRILDMDALVVEAPGHRMTGEDLARALAADPYPENVVGVVATAGTTNAGIVDDIAGIAAVAQSNGMWLHVDAAYGGAALLAPSTAAVFAGIEHADSITMDPHKWWFAPFDCAAIIYRDPQIARRVHTQHASYLDVLHGPEVEWNPTDYAFHLTRRARGLPLWFSLVVNGVDAYRDAVESSLQLTTDVANVIRSHPRLELVREPSLSVVLWRVKGWEATDYSDMQQRLLTSQVGFVTPTSWLGETVGRFAFINPLTTLDMVREMFDEALR